MVNSCKRGGRRRLPVSELYTPGATRATIEVVACGLISRA